MIVVAPLISHLYTAREPNPKKPSRLAFYCFESWSNTAKRNTEEKGRVHTRLDAVGTCKFLTSNRRKKKEILSHIQKYNPSSRILRTRTWCEHWIGEDTPFFVIHCHSHKYFFVFRTRTMLRGKVNISCGDPKGYLFFIGTCFPNS